MLDSYTLEKFGKTFLHNGFLKSSGLKVFSVGNFKIMYLVNSLVVQWSGLGAFTAVGLSSIAGRKTKIPEAAQHGKNNKIKQHKNTREYSAHGHHRWSTQK